MHPLCLQAGQDFHAARTRFAAMTETVVEALEKRGPYADTDFSLAACFMRIEVRRSRY